LEGWQGGGANREVTSPIEGLPDVEQSHCISAQFADPDVVPHTSKMLPGISEQPLVVNAADMDEGTRSKGFGGDGAKKMIMQALGKDGRRTKYQDIAAAQRLSAGVVPAEPQVPEEQSWEEGAAGDGTGLESAAASPGPPSGARVIKVRGGGGQQGLQPPTGFKSVRKAGRGRGRGAPY